MRLFVTTLPSPPSRGDYPTPPSPSEKPGARPQRSRRRWLLSAVLVSAVVIVCVAGVVIATGWPYSEAMVVPSVEDAFKTRVTVQHFRRFYYPNPGCVAEELVLANPENRAGAPPLATVRRVTIMGRYADLLFRPHHLDKIELEGLQVRVPSASARNFRWDKDSESSKVTVRLVEAKDATLEIAKDNDQEPLRFDLHELRLSSLAAHAPIDYEVRMTNAVPRGELESKGSFGPWRSGQLAGTPLHGTVKLKDAKLDELPGIGGTLQSEEKFGGTLGAIEVKGNATSADFHLKTTEHKIALTAQFQVLVDALKGEARIREVTAKLGHTPFRVQGSVTKNASLGRRETLLDFTILRGRVEDALWLFNRAANPPMTGPASGSAHVRAPEFGEGFFKQLVLNGKFEISDGRFQAHTQEEVNRLSARAQGVKVDKGSEAPDVTVDALDSEVTIRNGLANFPNLFFMIPGAHARMQGTYDLESHAVKMEGNLWTLATISQESDGIKSMLLKPIDPLFKRKHAGARVGVTMTGDVDEPRFSIVLTRDKKTE